MLLLDLWNLGKLRLFILEYAISETIHGLPKLSKDFFLKPLVQEGLKFLRTKDEG